MFVNTLVNILSPSAGNDKVGKRAAPLQGIKMVQGDMPDIFKRGAVTVLESWATWCPPCVRSIPHLNKMYNS